MGRPKRTTVALPYSNFIGSFLTSRYRVLEKKATLPYCEVFLVTDLEDPDIILQAESHTLHNLPTSVRRSRKRHIKRKMKSALESIWQDGQFILISSVSGDVNVSHHEQAPPPTFSPPRSVEKCTYFATELPLQKWPRALRSVLEELKVVAQTTNVIISGILPECQRSDTSQQWHLYDGDLRNARYRLHTELVSWHGPANLCDEDLKYSIGRLRLWDSVDFHYRELLQQGRPIPYKDAISRIDKSKGGISHLRALEHFRFSVWFEFLKSLTPVLHPVVIFSNANDIDTASDFRLEPPRLEYAEALKGLGQFGATKPQKLSRKAVRQRDQRRRRREEIQRVNRPQIVEQTAATTDQCIANSALPGT